VLELFMFQPHSLSMLQQSYLESIKRGTKI
jgi:hypothetical protein